MWFQISSLDFRIGDVHLKHIDHDYVMRKRCWWKKVFSLKGPDMRFCRPTEAETRHFRFIPSVLFATVESQWLPRGRRNLKMSKTTVIKFILRQFLPKLIYVKISIIHIIRQLAVRLGKSTFTWNKMIMDTAEASSLLFWHLWLQSGTRNFLLDFSVVDEEIQKMGYFQPSLR